MQPGLGSPDGDIKDPGHFRQRQVKVEMQDHHGPLIDGETTQLASEQVPIDHRAGEVVGARRLRVGLHVQLDQVPALLRACQPVAGAHRGAIEPGVPRVRITDGTDVPPREDECFLDRILGTILVAQDEAGDAAQSGERASHQDGEGLVITRSCSFDELSLHVITGSSRHGLPRSQDNETGDVPNGSHGRAMISLMASHTELWLVRHGQTEWSRDARHTSTTDLALLPEGEEDARGLVPRLAPHHPFDLVLTSPRLRARMTAELAGFPDASVDADLAEWDYGAYEGMSTLEIRRQVPDWTVWTHGASGGESVADMTARLDRVIVRVLANGGRTLCFGHGHALRALAARWIGQPVTLGRSLALDTSSISVLGYDRDTPVIVRWNQ